MGQALATALGREFADTDRLIEKKCGCSTESLIYERGWQEFRRVERDVVMEISKKDNLVIATGGGVVLNHKNVDNLKRNGWVVWLQAEDEILKKRMECDHVSGIDRAPLMGQDSLGEIKQVLELRNPLYSKMEDASVDCSTLKIEDAVDVIIKNLPEGI